MESMYLLIPISVILVFLIGVIFWWSLRSGQFDDLEGPAYRILMDDDLPVSARSSPTDGNQDGVTGDVSIVIEGEGGDDGAISRTL